MDVQDSHGHRVHQIPARSGTFHVVKVENIATLKHQHARVTCSLPNGRLRLEFSSAKLPSASWSDTRLRIAKRVTVEMRCELRKKPGGSANTAEPIQCDDVEDSVGSLAFSSATSGVPFAMTIEVK